MGDPLGLARAILRAESGAAALLGESGFRDPESAARCLERLCGPGAEPPMPAGVLAAILASGRPFRALHGMERFVEASGPRAELYRRLDASTPLREGLARILAHSSFLTDLLVRIPEHLNWLFEETPHLTGPLPAAELRARQQQSLRGLEGSSWEAALRRFHGRELLRIGTAEILGCKEVSQVGRELSELADVTVEAVLDHQARSLHRSHGRPSTERGRPSPFCVVGLGKYGGLELNFSSDIDLLFLYEEDGTVVDSRGVQGIANGVFFDRLAEGLIQVLTEVTPEGFLYRVDMRLRPEGERGPLTRSLRSYWIYYESRGELWERQMLIKARRAAGSSGLWRRFRDMLVPFVYPAHFTVSPSEEIRRIKERIEAEARTRPEGGNNIKLQPGGIRDIEFAVQCLQLLHGRRTERTRAAGTLPSIERLRQAGALSAGEARALGQAYRFLRRLENLLQIDSGRPTYTVPEDGSEQAEALRDRLQLGGRSLSSSVASHLSAVRGVYESVFGSARGPASDPGAEDPRWLLDAPAGSEGVGRSLEAAGFRQVETAHRLLRQLGGPLLTSSGLDNLKELLVPLLPQLAATPDPDGALLRFVGVIDAYGAPGAFYGMALAHPRFLAMLVTICGRSALLAGLLQRDPGLLDELVGLDFSGRMPPLDRATRVDLSRLRRYRNNALLRIGTDDLLGLTPGEETFLRISDLADEVVSAVVDDALTAVARRRGRPHSGRRLDRDARFACFAGGKAGGRELDFASDLDLFFLYEGEGRTGRGVDNAEFFDAVVRQVIQVLGEGLFEVDARLRPEGRRAPVVISLPAYRRYLRTRASTWERLALSRARHIAGDRDLGRRVHRAVDAFVYGTPLTPGMVDEIAGIRRRMQPKAVSGRGPVLDIKRGPGGIVDAEFIAQILLLHHGARQRDLRDTSTPVVLERLIAAGLLKRQEGAALLAAYERLRQLQKALRLGEGHSSHVLPADPAAAGILARAMGADSADVLAEEVTDLMGQTRRLFDQIVDRVRTESARGTVERPDPA